MKNSFSIGLLLSIITFYFGNISYAQMQTKALYVCNEGLMNHNNGTLSYFNFDNGTEDADFFLTRNRRGLGDTPNDMQLYGNKIYIVVNISSQIEVIDAGNGKSVKQISMITDDKKSKQPRHITFYEGKAYISSLDGTVTCIDTASLVVEKSVKVGRNPEGICAWNGKLYVANSGGLDAPNYDNTISIIDIASFKEIKKIIVGMNPFRVLPDGMGNIYVSTRGDYESSIYSFKRIDTQAEEVFDMGIDVLNFNIHGDYAYLYNYDFSKKISWIKLFNLKTRSIERENFITDGTTIRCPYGVFINPANNDVYVCDAGKNFVEEGDVYCFDKEGKRKTKYADVGLNPNCIVFVNEGTLSIVAPAGNEPARISIYPNPITDYVFVENAEHTHLLLFDVHGRVLIDRKLQSNKEKVDISYLNPAIYFLQIKTAWEKKVFRVVKN